jgi:hypothetical protein
LAEIIVGTDEFREQWRSLPLMPYRFVGGFNPTEQLCEKAHDPASAQGIAYQRLHRSIKASDVIGQERLTSGHELGGP